MILSSRYSSVATTTTSAAANHNIGEYNTAKTTTHLPNPFSKDSLLYIENPQLDAFAACLMIMDDNRRLIEWLAYHYFALPLRHLVVLVDGPSTTSPHAILDRWRPYMNIQVWNETRLSDPTVRSNRTAHSAKTAFAKYKARQGVFYRDCASYLQQQNATWTAFHDVDEYAVLNANDPHTPWPRTNATTRIRQPGSILRTLRDVRVHMALHRLPTDENYNGTCITTYRRNIGFVQTTRHSSHVRTNHTTTTTTAPPDVVLRPHERFFDTIRFRHYGRTLIGKSFFNVKHLNVTSRQAGYWHNYGRMGAHRVLPWCPSPWPKTPHWIIMNHYLGDSWQEVSRHRPHDPRFQYETEQFQGQKKQQEWIQEARISLGTDDTLRFWVTDFIQYMGVERARTLLAPEMKANQVRLDSTHHTVRGNMERF